KKSILVVASSFPRTKDDWWARFVLNIYMNMPTDAYNITILAPHAPNAHKVEYFGNLKVVRFSYWYPYSLQKLTSGIGILHSSKTSIFSKLQVPLFLLSEFINIG